MFTQGQRVRMLIETVGDDQNDEEQTWPAGTLGTICLMEQDRKIYHVEIGSGEREITNCFDFGEEAEKAMEPYFGDLTFKLTEFYPDTLIIHDDQGAKLGSLEVRLLYATKEESRQSRLARAALLTKIILEKINEGTGDPV